MRPRLIVALLWVLAVVAVAITVPTAVARRSGPGPAAPGLAALRNEQLAGLLPADGDFPDEWTIKRYPGYSDRFGYWVYHRADTLGAATPGECADVEYGASPDTSIAVDVGAEVPTAIAPSPYPSDVRLMIGREFRPKGFDEMIARVSRCATFITQPFSTHCTARILEDRRRPGEPQIFRYSVTTDFGGGHTRVRYYSYARTSRLILSGESIEADRDVFDRLFAETMIRIRAVRS